MVDTAVSWPWVADLQRADVLDPLPTEGRVGLQLEGIQQHPRVPLRPSMGWMRWAPQVIVIALFSV